MRVVETLTSQQLISLLEGNAVGFFPYMVLSTDSFYSKLNELCLGYYMHRSGSKTVSNTYNRIVTLSKDSGIQQTADEIFGRMIRSKFIEKWNRVYDTLITEQYNALDSTNYTETKTGDNIDSNIHNNETVKSGTNSDNTIYGSSVETDTETSSKETITTTDTNQDDIWAFNSPNSVPQSKSDSNTTETSEGNAQDNKEHNFERKSGNDQVLKSINETERDNGTDTHNYTIRETKTNSGRDVAGADLIDKELNLRNNQIFFDIIYRDIDSIFTIQIYS